MMHYGVAFIGSGHANWHAAVALRKAGKSVVLIEKDALVEPIPWTKPPR